MSSEPDEFKASSWIAFWIVAGTLIAFLVGVRVFNSPNADAPKYSGGVDPRNYGGVVPPPDERDRVHFGLDKAVAIAIEEVNKREGWSAKPEWASVEFGEAGVWDVIVRRLPRPPVPERRVGVSAFTGKVQYYTDPSDSR